ncbi:MAG: hypothetical protein JW983_08010 [Elusimicrobia bacterium]|nr:hypothetical protein [Elusimicrobiota bacterium]
MRMIVKSKYVKREGYWFNIERDGDKYYVVNTKRKRSLTDRDSLPFIIKECDSLVEAKKYLENLLK